MGTFPIPNEVIVDANGRPMAPSTVDNKNILEVANNNWWLWAPNFLDIVRNPDDIGLPTYDKMYKTDESVASAMKFTQLAALSKLGEYTHENESIEQFIRSILVRAESSWIESVREILSAITYGFSASEILYRFEPGRNGKKGAIVFDGLLTMHPVTIMLDIFRDGPSKNKISRIVQWYHNLYEAVIPVEKCIVYSHNKSFGNHYGESRLRPAYKNWKIKDIALKSWSLTLERYGSPLMHAQVDGNTTWKVNGKDVDAFAYMQKQLNALATSQSGIVTDKNTEVKINFASRAFGADFLQLVEYCNKMVFRACLVPSLIGDHGSHGSYSLGQKHYDLFVLELEKLLEEVIQVLIQQLIRPIIDANFGPQDDYGDFAIENFEADDEKMISEVMVNLINAHLLNPMDIEDNNYARTRVGIPVIDEARLTAWAMQMAQSQLQADSQGNGGDQGQIKTPEPALGKGIPQMAAKDALIRSHKRIEDLYRQGDSMDRERMEKHSSLLAKNRERARYSTMYERRENRMRAIYRRQFYSAAAGLVAGSNVMALAADG